MVGLANRLATDEPIEPEEIVARYDALVAEPDFLASTEVRTSDEPSVTTRSAGACMRKAYGGLKVRAASCEPACCTMWAMSRWHLGCLGRRRRTKQHGPHAEAEDARPKMAQERNAAPLQIEVPLKGIPPGRYECQVNVVDRIGQRFAWNRTRLTVVR